MLPALALVLTLTGCAKPATFAPAPPSVFTAAQQLRADISALLGQPGLRRTSWGIAVESLTSGQRLFEMNPSTLFVPGSTMKIVTAATAAAAVGWDYTFETTVAATGPIEAGVLRGDLVITGTGDPSLDGRGGTSFLAALVAAMRDKQVTRVEGRLVGDDNLVEEPRPGLAWSWDDLGTTSGAIAGALNIGENTTYLTIAPAAEPGGPTTITPSPHGRELTIINRSATARRQSPLTLWAEQRPADAGLTIAGTIAAGAQPARLTVAVGNPTLWFARVVRAHLIANGIDIQGAAFDVDDLTEPLGAAAPILSHRSRPLREIIAAMMKDSINMYADAVVRLATGTAGSRTIADDVAAERRQLAAWGIAEGTVQPADGSGLSRFNLITADALVAVLKRMQDGGAASPFVQSLPIAGVDGSLENRMKDTPAAGHVQAKTGSMTNVRSLAGYVSTRDGETLAFAIIANNFESGSAPVIAAIDRTVIRLAEFSRR